MSKQLLLISCATLLMMSCSKKETPVPQTSVEYLNLNNTVVTANNVLTIDLDKDGTADFTVTKELREGDAGENDLLEFRVTSVGQHRILMLDNGTPARKEEGVLIKNEDELPYRWDPLLSAALVTRVLTLDIANSYWQGEWMNQYNKYLAVQLIKDGKAYQGWIQISFSQILPTRIIVHDAAYNKIAGQPIKAGQK